MQQHVRPTAEPDMSIKFEGDFTPENDHKPLIAFSGSEQAMKKVYSTFHSSDVKVPFAGAMGRIIIRGKDRKHMAVTGHYMPEGNGKWIGYVSQPFFIEELETAPRTSSPVLGGNKYDYVRNQTKGIDPIQGSEQQEAAKQVALSILQGEKAIGTDIARQAGYNPRHPIFARSKGAEPER